MWARAASFRPLPLPAQDRKALRDNFALCLSKLKGPYTENFCVCPDGKRVAVRGANGQVGAACKNALFCAAFRAPWAEALAKQRIYIANLFRAIFTFGTPSRITTIWCGGTSSKSTSPKPIQTAN